MKIFYLAGLTLFVTISSVLAHEGTLNQIPWVACEDKTLNQDCEFYNANEDRFRGTCQSISDVLMCVRNQPIEYSGVSKDTGEHHHDDEPEHTHTE